MTACSDIDFLLSKGWVRVNPGASVEAWISPITGTRYTLAAAPALYGR